MGRILHRLEGFIKNKKKSILSMPNKVYENEHYYMLQNGVIRDTLSNPISRY